MKKIYFLSAILIASLMILPTPASAQRAETQKALGMSIKASTMGFGTDIIFSLRPDLSFRLGFEKLGYQTPIKFDEQGISYSGIAEMDAGAVSLLADFYFGNYFFLSAGAGYNLFGISFKGSASEPLPFGDIEIPVEMIGDFSFKVDPGSRISPYLGIGGGRTLGLNKAVGVSLEAGAYYQGAPQITIESSGLLSPTSNPDHGHAERLEKQVSQYSMYPIVRLSINYRFLNF